MRARRKLEYWDVPQFPRIRAQRCLQVLGRLSALVPPRVLAATWRTQWNGWVTFRRFQGRGGHADRCAFCGPGAQDAIQHYASCPHVWRFAQSRLGIQRPASRGECLACFLLLDMGPNSIDADPSLLARKALRTAAVYKVHCMVRHGAIPAGAAAQEALQQAVRELVRGHAAANRALGQWC